MVVVEHDPTIILGSNHVIDLEPGGGSKGGELLYSRGFASIFGEYELTANRGKED